jgi:branched-chain amino acid transport system permease protein
MVIRAGVDDRHMTSALGINIQLTFAIAFFVGSALAGFGGAVGATQNIAATGSDRDWLLNSLVVVIIGGMGSMLGAAIGSLLYGLVYSFSAVYLPSFGNNCCTQYSIIFTFVLLTLVLAFRPQGLVGRPG